MLYHNKVGEDMRTNCLVRVLLVWWETSTEEASAKAVHTISVFMKQFLEKGHAEVSKTSEAICVFFMILLRARENSLSINRQKVSYNLKAEEFFRRTLIISMTVLKYQKESRQVIWRYMGAGAELGPQELFLMFILREGVLAQLAEKALLICDFQEEAPLETLIMVKQRIEQVLEQLPDTRKKLIESLRRVEKDLEDKIEMKGQETFDEELLKGLKNEFHEYEQLIDKAA